MSLAKIEFILALPVYFVAYVIGYLCGIVQDAWRSGRKNGEGDA